jgi:hypothetical protein
VKSATPSTTPSTHDLAIAGFGPVGRLLSLLLGRAGHDIVVLERWQQPYHLPRAVHFDDEIGRISRQPTSPRSSPPSPTRSPITTNGVAVPARLWCASTGPARDLDMLANSAEEPLTRPRAHFEFLREELQRSGFTGGCMFGNFGNEMADHSTALQDIRPVTETFPLEKAADAYAHMLSGQARFRAVLSVGA